MFFAQEKFAPFTRDTDDRRVSVYARINVDRQSDFEQIGFLPPSSTIPVLYQESSIHPSRFDSHFCDAMIEQYIACAKILIALGYQQLVIAADNDGLLQKLLSPRFSSNDLTTRMQPLLLLFSRLLDVIKNVGVLLTIEELAPGGMDATDGIAVARALEKRGLTEIIVSCGTKDFMPLYDRRMTKKKRIDCDEFSSNEPSMASALWLLPHTQLKVICASFIDDQQSAVELANRLGLTGLIEKAPPPVI